MDKQVVLLAIIIGILLVGCSIVKTIRDIKNINEEDK